MGPNVSVTFHSFFQVSGDGDCWDLHWLLGVRSVLRLQDVGVSSSLLICHPVPDSFHVIVSSEGFVDNFSSILPRTFNFLTFKPTQMGTIVFKLVLIPVVFSTLPCQCASTLMCPCWPSCSPALIVWSYYCQYLHPSPGPSMSCQPEHPHPNWDVAEHYQVFYILHHNFEGVYYLQFTHIPFSSFECVNPFSIIVSMFF